VDDNVTLDMPRFEALCRAIVAAGLNDVDYVVQGMTSAFARHGQTVAPLMRRAGFRYVFLGIENVLDGDLVFLRASAKNRIRVQGQADDATLAAVEHVRRNGMYVVGGLIVGNPDDTPEAIEANLRFARRHVDWPYIQHPTPYPGTPMTRDFEARGLVVNRRAEEYDGTTAVVRTSSLDAAEIEFLRWRAERWMKLAHLPAALAHSPRFVLRHGWRMLRETFHGSSLRSSWASRTAAPSSSGTGACAWRSGPACGARSSRRCPRPHAPRRGVSPSERAARDPLAEQRVDDDVLRALLEHEILLHERRQGRLDARRAAEPMPRARVGRE
jgi:hypothetical protein